VLVKKEEVQFHAIQSNQINEPISPQYQNIDDQNSQSQSELPVPANAHRKSKKKKEKN